MIVFHTIDDKRWSWEEDETKEYWDIVLEARLKLNQWIPATRLNAFDEPVGTIKNVMTNKIIAWEIIDAP